MRHGEQVGEQSLILGRRRIVYREFAAQILENHRQAALGQIAEAVGEIGVGGAHDRFGRIAAILSEADLAQQIIAQRVDPERSEEHTSELQSLLRISYAVLCLKKKNKYTTL